MSQGLRPALHRRLGPVAAKECAGIPPGDAVLPAGGQSGKRSPPPALPWSGCGSPKSLSTQRLGTRSRRRRGAGSCGPRRPRVGHDRPHRVDCRSHRSRTPDAAEGLRRTPLAFLGLPRDLQLQSADRAPHRIRSSVSRTEGGPWRRSPRPVGPRCSGGADFFTSVRECRTGAGCIGSAQVRFGLPSRARRGPGTTWSAGSGVVASPAPAINPVG